MEWSIHAVIVLGMKWRCPVSVSTFLSEANSSESSQMEFLFPMSLKLILSSRVPRRGT